MVQANIDNFAVPRVTSVDGILLSFGQGVGYNAPELRYPIAEILIVSTSAKPPLCFFSSQTYEGHPPFLLHLGYRVRANRAAVAVNTSWRVTTPLSPWKMQIVLPGSLSSQYPHHDRIMSKCEYWNTPTFFKSYRANALSSSLSDDL